MKALLEIFGIALIPTIVLGFAWGAIALEWWNIDDPPEVGIQEVRVDYVPVEVAELRALQMTCILVPPSTERNPE